MPVAIKPQKVMHDIFALPRIQFPENFLWGSSTSAYQIEGGNENNDWARAAREGKFPEACGMACNHYALYREDIALLKELGHQAFRFSVEWSRVEPHEGQFDDEAVEHYVDCARRLCEAGIKPWLTLYHFTNPIWFADKKEWHERDNVGCFLRYVEYIVPKLAPYIDGWAPINEYNFYSGAPSQPEDHRRMANYAFNVLLADAGAYDIIKAHSSKPCASPMAYLALQPLRPHDPFDKTMADYADWVANGWYFHAMRTGELVFPFVDMEYHPEVKGRADHWAVNMYARDLVDSRRQRCRGDRYQHRALKINRSHQDNPWEFSPDELLANIMRLNDKPVYILENGCNTDDDRFRVLYIALHVAAFHQALDWGLDLKSYFYWSFIDNYEWGSYDPKFGLTKPLLPVSHARVPGFSGRLFSKTVYRVR
jgi:beta-glucosidase